MFLITCHNFHEADRSNYDQKSKILSLRMHFTRITVTFEQRRTCVVQSVGKAVASSGLDAKLEKAPLPETEEVADPIRRRIRERESLPPGTRSDPLRRGF